MNTRISHREGAGQCWPWEGCSLWMCLAVLLLPLSVGKAQVVSPLQGGHFAPGVANIRDYATPPSGLFLLWYNTYTSSNTFVDREGNEFNNISLSRFGSSLPPINVSLRLKAVASIPTVFWASAFTFLGGARYMAGASLNYVSSDASFITERSGIVIDTTYTRTVEGKSSGFSDMLFVPLGLSWGMDRMDLTFMYGVAAPTGKYETGSADNMGLGFWTHQFQGYGYIYPLDGKATAIMLGLTYEINSKIKDADVTPGNRLSLAWGISQYFSERFEVGVQGGHNWQITDDTGDDVYWDPSVHDRKSTLGFAANYWVWNERLSLTLMYSFDFWARQRFVCNSWLLNAVFVPNLLTGN